MSDNIKIEFDDAALEKAANEAVRKKVMDGIEVECPECHSKAFIEGGKGKCPSCGVEIIIQTP